MSFFNKAKDLECKAKAEAQDIKENVVDLACNVYDSSANKTHAAAKYLRHRMDDLKASGSDTLTKVEGRIKANPGQSIAIAFAAGLLAKFLLGRKS